MSKFCHDCIHWEKVIPIAGDDFGICHNVEVAMKVALDGKTHLSEDGAFWTAKYFGCIHWRRKELVIIKTDDLIKKI